MNIEKEIPQRLDDSAQLVEDFNLHEDAEFFKDPSTRIDFLKSLTYDKFQDIAQHVNARVRGYEPRERKTVTETGGYLPMLRTPAADEKSEAFRNGFEVIQEYLTESNDSPDEKAKGVGMAVEALVVWVHPFNDGNGRTSRFLGKFIEDGTTDTDQLIAETSSRNERMRMYSEYARVDDTTDLDNGDILLDDDEIEEIRKAQEALPIAEGIALSVKGLLEDKVLQQRIESEAENNKAIRAQALARRTAA